jgi:hypothetical protein
MAGGLDHVNADGAASFDALYGGNGFDTCRDSRRRNGVRL